MSKVVTKKYWETKVDLKDLKRNLRWL